MISKKLATTLLIILVTSNESADGAHTTIVRMPNASLLELVDYLEFEVCS